MISGSIERIGALGLAPRDVLEALLASIPDAVYVVDHAGRVAFANPAALDLLGYDESELLGQVSHPTIHHHHWDGTPFPEEQCPMLRPRVTGETVRVDDDCFWRQDGSKFRVAYSSAPLPIAGQRGAIVVFRDATERIEAEQAAVRAAAERARAAEIYDSRARIIAAADEERRRIGRDLHDGAQQRLVSLGLQIRRMQRSLPREAAILAPALDQIVGEVGSAIADLRQIAAGVRPARLDDGLAAALHDLARSAPIAVEVEAPIGRVAASVEAAAYFVVCEALTNAVKHASASHVQLRAIRENGTLRLSVADNGVGGARARRGSGLDGLGDRVSAHGGTLVIASPRGGGTRIEVAIPCGS
jgi:PAS domain S-box-containing protein